MTRARARAFTKDPSRELAKKVSRKKMEKETKNNQMYARGIERKRTKRYERASKTVWTFCNGKRAQRGSNLPFPVYMFQTNVATMQTHKKCMQAIKWRCNCFSCHRFFCVCVCVLFGRVVCFFLHFNLYLSLSGKYHYYKSYPISMVNPANYPHFVRWLVSFRNKTHYIKKYCSSKSVFRASLTSSSLSRSLYCIRLCFVSFLFST